MHTNNGTPFAFATNTGATSTEDVWYDVCIMHSAGDIEVWRRERGSGDEMTTIFNEYTMFAAMQTNHWWIWMETTTAGDYEFDDFSRVSNLGAYDPHKDLFTYNDANELVSGGGCDYYYDDWGRLISKEDGTHEADYGYAYGHKLWAVQSDFPGEANVQYWYTGDGRRYSRECGSDKSYYFFDEGYNLVNEANGSGVLQRSYVTGNRAQFTSMASYTYFLHDHLGNARRLLDSSKDTVAAYDYTPYGLVYGHAGDLDATTHLYTGHDWDAQAGLYYAPYRYYNPFTARWMKRDPAGMVDGPNLYAYVVGNPINFVDPLGASMMADWWNAALGGFGGRRGYLDNVGLCMGGEGPLTAIPSGLSFPVWPHFKMPGEVMTAKHGPYTTIASRLRTMIPVEYRLPRRILRVASKASAWITIADGVLAYAKIVRCSGLPELFDEFRHNDTLWDDILDDYWGYLGYDL